MKRKYILDEPQNGIDIDWQKVIKTTYALIKKVCKKNNIDLNSFYIPTPPFDSARHFVEWSERSVGKTTTYLLFGLVIFKLYDGLKFEYIRTNKDGIMPKNASDLFDVVKRFDYIAELFDNKWNSICMGARCWYLCNVDENGVIIEKDGREVMHMHCLNSKEVDNEKSVYNSEAAYIIWDEVIPVDGVTTEQQWLNFCQLHSTIRRQRLNVKTVFLSNTIDKYTHLFDEMMISGAVQKMRLGEEQIIETPRGVKLWLHFIKAADETQSQKRIENNLLFYGFNNPKLNAIIGGEEWETRNYPHLSQYLSRDEEKTRIEGRVYFNFQGRFLAWELWKTEKLGLYAFVRPYYHTPKEDAIIYTLETPRNSAEIFGVGLGTNLDRTIVNFLNQHKTFYASNDCGAQFEAYFKTLRSMQKLI